MEVDMDLQLTEKEEELLKELLEEHHKHLLHEINKAHHHEFKKNLRHRCTTVEDIVEKLKLVTAAA